MVISNETNQGILAYYIRWKFTTPDGKVKIHESTIFNSFTEKPGDRRAVSEPAGTRHRALCR
jgi:hypothetical protein